MILSIIILSIIVLLTGILLIPVILAINTETETYYLKLSGIFKVWLQIKEGFKINMRIFFFRVQLNVKQMKSSTKNKNIRKWSGRVSKTNYKGLLKNVKKLIKIVRLDAAIDTGDYPVNAMLIPVTQTLNNNTIHININFQNENRLDFMLKTRIYKLILLYINFLLKTKK